MGKKAKRQSPELTVEVIKALPEKERLDLMKRAYGAQDDIEARFMLGIMDGSIKGDVLEVEED